jgi:molybdenum cofactor biosynthesis enzyme
MAFRETGTAFSGVKSKKRAKNLIPVCHTQKLSDICTPFSENKALSHVKSLSNYR